jgi:leucyl/phenylalanyl-tRNA---protein transferase
MPIFRLNEHLLFPAPELAEESGLLAVGGDLSPGRLILAYSSGIFPWPHEGMPLLWFSPDPRLVLPPGEIVVSRRLARKIRRGRVEVRLDTACRDVIGWCARIERGGEQGTWITREMAAAYGRLHDLGFVHSAESWLDGELVGGLYGISLGGVFVGESMFARVSDASKIALVTLSRQLARWGFDLIDSQVHTDHMERLGAREWPRDRYLRALETSLQKSTRRGRWSLDPDQAL